MTDTHFRPAAGESFRQDEEANRIIAAALTAFDAQGYGATKLDDIARRAGVRTSTLLQHFSSKDEVFREVVRTTLIGSLSARADATVPAEEPSAADAVRTLARRYLAAMSQPELATIVRLIVAELPRFPELAVFHATEALERFVRTLERVIEAGVARGELRVADVRSTSRTIVATLAMHALWFAHPGIYGGLTGTDRERAEATTLDALLQLLGSVTPQ